MEKFDYYKLRDLLSAHLQKENKVNIYYPRVDANLVNGKALFNATWSWWAFFGGWAFFLYRKMYLVAAIFFVLSILSNAIPFGGIILAIASGISGFYFYTIKLCDDLEKAGYETRDIEEVKKDLAKLGGYHSWVTIFAILFYAFILFFFSIVPGVFAFSLYMIN
ncbi:DUF2628 domain-containing protein [Arcobacter sp. LA11]|uniref:DUF2628 domain-containing protein n=1 Tax=Arcobacter sp. LA11 TaxID=1898176 RepID=UPI0009332A17|nr:DUF2628 domain-containing protein [Arcobacter sp. LA11]